MKRPHDIETIRGRFLIGRMDGAMQWARNDDELDLALNRLVAALQKHDDGKLWIFHLVLIRNDGGWAEQYLQLDPDMRKVDETVFEVCRQEIVTWMERLRLANSRPSEDDSKPPPIGTVEAARSTAPRGPSPSTVKRKRKPV